MPDIPIPGQDREKKVDMNRQGTMIYLITDMYEDAFLGAFSTQESALAYLEEEKDEYKIQGLSFSTICKVELDTNKRETIYCIKNSIVYDNATKCPVIASVGYQKRDCRAVPLPRMENILPKT